ncbi:hypothetical protein NB2BOR_A26460 [Bordetella parapertussis]|nr:hypothetical protein NB2BOR_A26460 [Bordetella parapertussis]
MARETAAASASSATEGVMPWAIKRWAVSSKVLRMRARGPCGGSPLSAACGLAGAINGADSGNVCVAAVSAAPAD